MRSLARWCFKHRRIVVVAWLAALFGVTAIHSGVGSGYSDNFKLPHTESFDAVRLLQRNAPQGLGRHRSDRVRARSGKVTDPATARACRGTARQCRRGAPRDVRQLPVRAVGANQISPSGQIGSRTSPSTSSPTSSRPHRCASVRQQDHLGVGQRAPVPGRGPDRRTGQNDNSAAAWLLRLPGRGIRPLHRVRIAPGHAVAADHRGVSLGTAIGSSACSPTSSPWPRSPTSSPC